MPTFRYAQAATRDLKAVLDAGLANMIATIAAEEGSTLPAPDVIRIGIHPAPVEAYAVELMPSRWADEDIHNNFWAVDVEVHQTLRASDADVLAAQLKLISLGGALVRTIQADISASNTEVDCLVGETTLSAAGADGQLVLTSTTTVTVRHQES